MTRRALNRDLFKEGKRLCIACNAVKLLNEFAVEKRNLSGRAARCVECERYRLLENFRANKQKYNALGRERYARDIEKELIRGKRYRTLNKTKTIERNKRYKTSDAGRTMHCANEAKRRSAKLKATPSWANLEKIKEIYMNCPKGYHVDHIMPLRGKNSCGLHVEYNLQYLPAIDNIRKGNRVEQGGGY